MLLIIFTVSVNKRDVKVQKKRETEFTNQTTNVCRDIQQETEKEHKYFAIKSMNINQF